MHRIACFLVLLLIASTSPATELPPTPGATAKALSFVAVGGAKLAATHESPAQPQLDRNCVLQLDNLALSGMFEGLLRQQLTERQRNEADRFYSRSFAGRYNELTLQQILVAKGISVEAPVKLSASEISEVNAFASSGTGAALTRVASESNPATLAELRPALMSLLTQCRA